MYKDIVCEAFDLREVGTSTSPLFNGVRLYHIPTGETASCGSYLTLNANKEEALRLLSEQINGKPTIAELKYKVKVMELTISQLNKRLEGL